MTALRDVPDVGGRGDNVGSTVIRVIKPAEIRRSHDHVGEPVVGYLPQQRIQSRPIDGNPADPERQRYLEERAIIRLDRQPGNRPGMNSGVGSIATAYTREVSGDHIKIPISPEIGEDTVMTIEDDSVLLLRSGIPLGLGQTMKPDPPIGMPAPELIRDRGPAP